MSVKSVGGRVCFENGSLRSLLPTHHLIRSVHPLLSPYRPVAFVGYVHDVRLKRHAIDHGAREDGVVGISVPQSKGGFMIVISESFSLGMAVHEINPVAVYATMAT